MPTNFPASNDVFNVPSVPAATPLGSTGDGSRTHSQHHSDLGDALDAMQVQQTLLAHSHDGVTARHGIQLLQVNTHESVDTDVGPTSIHHTIGSGANQYSAGTHTHVVVATYPVGAFFFAVVPDNPATLGVIGTWSSVGQRFLCASGGGLGFTAGATGGSNSHSHTIDSSTNTVSAHSHAFSNTVTGGSSIGGHGHGGGGVNANGVNHYHVQQSSPIGTFSTSAGGTSFLNANHSHTSAYDSAWHDHTPSGIGVSGDHAHNISPGSTDTGGSHSHTNSTPSTTNNLVPLFVVYMWKRTA